MIAFFWLPTFSWCGKATEKITESVECCFQEAFRCYIGEPAFLYKGNNCNCYNWIGC